MKDASFLFHASAERANNLSPFLPSYPSVLEQFSLKQLKDFLLNQPFEVFKLLPRDAGKVAI